MVRNTSLLGHFVLLDRVVALAMFAVASMPVADALDYNRDVRPILAKNCFTCHGPDEQAREAGLRLDTAEGATEDLGGYQAVVPGQPDESEVIARLSTDDEGLRMPPSDSHPPLSPKDIETLRQWIDGGAVYQTHWSFAQLRSVTVPEVKDVSWCRGPIDRFVKAKTESLELNHADEATKRQLIKRVFMDLVGVLPTPQQTEAFVADDSPVAYRRMVDRLLASPDYAENFARPWLDLARYADTNGYEKDRQRTIWPYRDWVIKAIGADMPMDEFSVQQLAGDMLHDATEDQKVATGFHRNTMLNEEGGIDPLEYRFYALVDRVATTGTVWMGLTVGCAQCHTHKYDPITHTDYYRMMALFDGADEPDLAITDRRAMQRREVIELQRQKLLEQLTAFVPDRDQLQELIVGEAAGDPIETAFSDFVESNINGAIDWCRIAPTEMESTSPKLTLLDDASVLGSGDVTKRDVFRLRFDLKDIAVDTDVKSVTALRLEALPHESLPAGGPGMAYYEGRKGDFFLSHLDVSVDGRPIELTALRTATRI